MVYAAWTLTNTVNSLKYSTIRRYFGVESAGMKRVNGKGALAEGNRVL